jgi:hypothetical protein
MEQDQNITDLDYKVAMGRLLVMYTQMDYLIMCAVAERIANAPDDESRLLMAKQVGDESRYVRIQQEWIKKFDTDITRVLANGNRKCFCSIFVRSTGWTF